MLMAQNSGNDCRITTIENYGPKVPPESTSAKAEELTITNNTGENRDYTLPIIIGVSILAMLGTGIVLVKRKMLKA